MEMTTQSQQAAESETVSLALPFEWIAYAILIALSLWLRVAELDVVPLTGHEATQALAAWRALHPALPGSAIVAESPLLFLLHGIGFTALGGTEFAARIFTALAGAGLALSPLLFRDVLGRGRAFLISLVLTFSPVLLIASRFDSSVIWTLLCALAALWALRRWWQTDAPGYMLVVSAASTALLLLTDPASWLFALALVGAGVGALLWNRVDNPDDDPLPEIRRRLRSWRWIQSLLVGVLTVLVVATASMLHLPGLSSVSQLVQVGISGLLTPVPGAPPFFALLTALFYEPVLWVFGIAGFVLLARQGELRLHDRFLALWVLLAGGAAMVYRGTGPDHALWLTLPLTALAAAVLFDAFQPDEHPFLDIPAWSKPVVAVAVCALLSIFSINFQGIARSFLRTPDGALTSLQPDPINAVWTLIALLFIITSLGIAASLWGRTAALRGAALGLMAFGLVTSLGSGWSTAVTRASNPVEFWHVEATGREYHLLRDTLIDLARRESGGFPHLTIYAQADDSGVIGWLLRDFVNARYITEPGEGRTQEVVLLPVQAEPPVLGGSYVGQDFVMVRTWPEATLLGFDVLPWWTQGRTRVPPQAAQTMVLWLRQDIYDGVEFDPNQG
jgi:4-amino-4-deoxy-L-arabinose transferase-like glycosyltransferase